LLIYILLLSLVGKENLVRDVVFEGKRLEISQSLISTGAVKLKVSNIFDMGYLSLTFYFIFT